MSSKFFAYGSGSSESENESSSSSDEEVVVQQKPTGGKFMAAFESDTGRLFPFLGVFLLRAA
jgi:hypothetical protein